MRSMLYCAGALVAGSLVVTAQPPQPGPPPVLQIIREVVKEGKGAAHERTELAYPRAFRKANSTDYYIAISSLSGSNEAWFLGGFPNWAAVEKMRGTSAQEPLKSDLEAAEDGDGAMRQSSRTMWAVLRKDLSYRLDDVNIGKTRYMNVGVYRARLGRETETAATIKAVLAGYEKAVIQASLVCYQVIEGAPNATYVFFSPMTTLATMDEMPARQAALRQAMGSATLEGLMKSAGDVFVSIESNLFAMSPSMSFPAPATVAADPAFWSPPPPATKAKPKANQ